MEQQTTLKLGELIHYGSTVYDPSRVQSVQNQAFIKPLGGLWTSPVNSDWGWRDWCKSEEFRDCEDKNSFHLRLHTWAKVYVIDCMEDLLRLPRRKMFEEFYKEIPNYELIAKDYDAIWLTERGQNETRFGNEIDLYGWDCETVFIMNATCVYQVQTKIEENENKIEKRTEMEGRHCVANECGSACSCREDSSLDCPCVIYWRGKENAD